MRPARKGPENAASSFGVSIVFLRFNEAGPQGAGKLGGASAAFVPLTGFNEAGPQGAGKRPRCKVKLARGWASMRPARKGPENLECAAQPIEWRPASMRPARKGPENTCGHVPPCDGA